MDALLIIGGLLLMLAGLVWLVMRAFATSLLWGWGSLIPPLTLVYIVRHWARARSAMTLLGLGIIPLVVGLTMLASKDGERLAAIISLDWLEPAEQAPAELAIELNGELNGAPFRPQQGELIDGVLSLREGADFFALRELNIRLPQPLGGDPIRVDVLPQDSENLPEVELSWLLPEQDLPEARRLNRGYTLHLDLQAQAPNRLVGDFHLVLPPRFKTSLSGRVELFTDRLRYRDGEVDRSFDSRDTIAHVLRDYLQRRFATRNVEALKLPPFTFTGPTLELRVDALIDQRAESLPIRLSKREGQGWSVDADRFPPLPAVQRVQHSEVQSAPVEEKLSRPVDRRQRFSLARLQRNPEQYRNLSMRLSRASGGTVEGRFVGIGSDGSILLSQLMGTGGGQAGFSFRPEEIGKLELLEP